jgi:disulfide bond formation protein DsbB
MSWSVRWIDPVLRRWPLAALVISALMLAIAHAFQTFGGLAPCHLCLQQREVYWVAIGVAGLGVVAMLLRLPAASSRLDSGVLVLVFAFGAYLAAFHAGAEWKWWSAPVTCMSTGPVKLSALKALLAGAGAHQPACDQAPWVFLGLSMAGWNFVASVGLVGLSLVAALRKDTRG